MNIMDTSLNKNIITADFNRARSRRLEVYPLFEDSPQLLEALKAKNLIQRAELVAAIAEVTGRKQAGIQVELCSLLGGEILMKSGMLKTLAVTIAKIADIEAEQAYQFQIQQKTSDPHFTTVRKKPAFAQHRNGRPSDVLDTNPFFAEKAPALLIVLKARKITTRADLAKNLIERTSLPRSVEGGGLRRFLEGDVVKKSCKTMKLNKLAIEVADMAGLSPEAAYRSVIDTSNYIDFLSVIGPQQPFQHVQFKYKEKTTLLIQPFAKFIRAFVERGEVTERQLLGELIDPALINGKEQLVTTCLANFRRQFQDTFGFQLPVDRRNNHYVWRGEKINIYGPIKDVECQRRQVTHKRFILNLIR